MGERKERFLKLNSSNRGAALLSIIIVMAVASVLAMLALSISYSSFRMRNVDKKSSDNFYGAEKVLEEVCVGLQGTVSEQYIKAYTEVMENYGSYQNAEDMQSDYQTLFVNYMFEALETAGKKGFYDVSKLSAYVNGANYADGDTWLVTSDVTNKKNYIDEVADGICIRNVSVSYEKDSYFNQITTDIRVVVPAVSFARVGSMPAVTDYAVAADGGLVLNENTGYVVEGRVFAGVTELEDGKVDAAVTLKAGAMLNVKNTETTKSPTFVSEGDVKVIGSSETTFSQFLVSENTLFWADSVTADRSSDNAEPHNTIKLLGKSYIRDDVTLNGKANKLYLGGEYYGYSGSNTQAKESSAIIVNGAYTTLDMSALDTLVLSGTSFVGTKGEAYEELQKIDENLKDVNTSDILMGESVAVKSNQLIYLVSTEADGIVSNPMSYDQYLKLIEDPEWASKALSTQLSSIGRSVASYGNVKITPVFTNKTGGAVYLFLEFADVSVASQYFMDCYGITATGQKAQAYLNTYVDTFKFNNNELNHIVTKGNYLVPVEGSLIEDGTVTATYHAGTEEIAAFNLAGTYEELCQQSKFENLVDLAEWELFMKSVYLGEDFTDTENKTSMTVNSTVDGAKVVTFSAGSVPNVIQAILVDNEGKNPYRLDSNEFKGVIIATGDVEITGTALNTSGLIICKGKLNVVSGNPLAPVTMTYNEQYVSAALRMICNEADKSFSPLSVFKGYEGAAAGTGTEDVTDVRDCISFENWKSE